MLYCALYHVIFLKNKFKIYKNIILYWNKVKHHKDKNLSKVKHEKIK